MALENEARPTHKPFVVSKGRNKGEERPYDHGRKRAALDAVADALVLGAHPTAEGRLKKAREVTRPNSRNQGKGTAHQRRREGKTTTLKEIQNTVTEPRSARKRKAGERSFLKIFPILMWS